MNSVPPWLWPALLVLAVLVVFIWLTRPRVDYGWRPPLTQREQSFFRLLQPLVAEAGWTLLSQVAFSQFLLVLGEGQASRREWQRWRQKVADFLICDEAFNILAVIELDDRSHRGKEEADAARDAILNAAGIRTLRFAAMPSQRDLRQMMASLRE